MKSKVLRIATRKSPLALWQAQHVRERLLTLHPGLSVELLGMRTQGDQWLDSPLAKIGGKGLFVKELEQGILDGRADIAVHSMKDVPVHLPEGLHLAAIMPRGNPYDALVSQRYSRLEDLPANARIGTCSLRRQAQLLARYPGFCIQPLRGSVNTRLEKLDRGDYDAIVLACAGLHRLEMAARIASELPPEICLPAVGQGALGIECRRQDATVEALIAPLHHAPSAQLVAAERALNACLNGGCQVPIAAYAEHCTNTATNAKVQQIPRTGCDGELRLRAMVAASNGRQLLFTEQFGMAEQAAQIGERAAQHLLEQGAGALLSALGIEPNATH